MLPTEKLEEETRDEIDGKLIAAGWVIEKPGLVQNGKFSAFVAFEDNALMPNII